MSKKIKPLINVTQNLIKVFLLLIIIFSELTTSQTPHPLSFYPYKAGNVWQYRDLYTNEIASTKYLESDSTDSDGNIYIVRRDVSPGWIYYWHEKIDTAFNVYNLNFQPQYPRYKLAAGVGETWRVGYDSLVNREFRASVVGLYSDYVFGVFTTIKIFRFYQIFNQDTISLGDDYLASRFGLIQSHFYMYLSGAIIDSVKYGIIVGVSDENRLIVEKYKLYQNYPNPFNAVTQISFALPEKGFVTLKIYDVLGREVAVLVNEHKEAGYYDVIWNAANVPSGVFFYKIAAGNFTSVRKMLLAK